MVQVPRFLDAALTRNAKIDGRDARENGAGNKATLSFRGYGSKALTISSDLFWSAKVLSTMPE